MRRIAILGSVLFTTVAGVIACIGFEAGSPAELLATTGPADPTEPVHAHALLSASHPFQVWETLGEAGLSDDDLRLLAAECPDQIVVTQSETAGKTRITHYRFDGPCALPEGAELDAVPELATALHVSGSVEAWGPDLSSAGLLAGGNIRYDDFTLGASVDCGGETAWEQRLHGEVRADAVLDGQALPSTGEVTQAQIAERIDDHGGIEELRFTFDVRMDTLGPDANCAAQARSAAWDYQLSYRGDGNDRFDGFGTIATTELGAWTTQTSALVYGDATGLEGNRCQEPLTGSITVDAGGHTAALEADGASVCTSDHCSPWLLDGVRQGELCDIAKDPTGCNLGGGSTAPSASAPGAAAGLLVLGLGLVAVARRRRGLGA